MATKMKMRADEVQEVLTRDLETNPRRSATYAVVVAPGYSRDYVTPLSLHEDLAVAQRASHMRDVPCEVVRKYAAPIQADEQLWNDQRGKTWYAA